MAQQGQGFVDSKTINHELSFSFHQSSFWQRSTKSRPKPSSLAVWLNVQKAGVSKKLHGRHPPTGYQKRTTQISRELHAYSIDNFVAFCLK